MTSNLLISYPDIPFRATMTATAAADSRHPLVNLVTGERGARFQWAAEEDFNDHILFDLGSGNSQTIDHIILARASLLKGLGATTLQVQSSANNVAYADRGGTSANFQSRIFSGPRDEDLIFTDAFNNDFGAISGVARRYWRVFLGSSTANLWTLSKLYLGLFFDFGRDPSYPAVQLRGPRRPGDRDARYRFSLNWQGVTNEKRNEFYEKVLKYRDVNPIFLYDTNDLILNGIKLLHCNVIDCQFTPITTRYNNVDLMVEELI